MTRSLLIVLVVVLIAALVSCAPPTPAGTGRPSTQPTPTVPSAVLVGNGPTMHVYYLRVPMGGGAHRDCYYTAGTSEVVTGGGIWCSDLLVGG